MTKTAADHMEVRWRVKDSGEAWSTPQIAGSVSELVVAKLDRSQQYEFQARNVSSCGAKSNWAAALAHEVPSPPAGTLTLAALKAETDQAASDAAAANAELANIASDNLLTPGEKPVVIRDYNVITTEQGGIDAQATAYSITTQKTAYDNAVSALTSYLGTLTSPTAWNNLAGATTIVGSTFRSKFADVYTSRQALLNAIYAAARAKADAAQARADAAQDAADQAGLSTSVRNANFTGSTAGWSFTANPGPVAGGEFYQEATVNSPYPPIATYLVHAGQAGQSSAYANNLAYLPVAPGQVVTGVVCLQAFSANAGAYAAAMLKWYDASGTFLTITSGQPACGPGGSYLQCNSKAQAPAPSNAAFVRLSILYVNHTSGYINATACRVSGQLTSLDELPDGSIFQRSMQGWVSELVDNADFELALDSAGNVPGWSSYGGATLSLSTSSPFSGAQKLQVSSDAGANFGAISNRKYPVKAGDSVSVVAEVYGQSGAPGSVAAIFYNASGAAFYIASSDNPVYSTWNRVSLVFSAPSGSSYFRILLYNKNTSGGTTYFDQVRLSINDVRVAGSGARLGDLRNQVMAGVGNYGAGWSGGTISYSATSSSATITASAATLRVGPDTLAYNQSSTTVSGPHDGNQHTYYLYYDDDTYAGGSRTLHATESRIVAQSANGRLFVGQVSFYFPSSGTSGGGGGMTCPDENAWVLRADPNGIRPDWAVQAKTVRAGHFLRLTDGTAGLVTHSERKPAERVRVFDENGATLTCSTSAPLELAGTAGECVLAPDATGRKIKALADGVAFAPFVWKVEEAGPGYVQHITCQNACFWTGDDPGYLFGHHNMKQMENP
ncbi:MAG TPA: hypothetical protein VFW82_06705 [Dyella sp.]|nr:hypothetical protein [Dyella sp.]